MISILVDPSFSRSVWCVSMLDGLISQLKLKRLQFREIADISQVDDACRYLFLVATDDAWVRSALEACKKLDVYPILLSNESYHAFSCEYSTVCSDVFSFMRQAVESLHTMDRYRIALYGVNPWSISDRGRMDAYLQAIGNKDPQLFYNKGSLENCYQEFIRTSRGLEKDFDAIICANSLAAISLVRRLLVEDPERLNRLLILGYQEVRLAELYSDHFHAIKLHFEEYGKAAVMILDSLRRNPKISHMIVAIKWEEDVLDQLRGKALEPVPRSRVVSLREPEDVFYEDEEINEMMLLEKLLYESEDVDKTILRCLMRGNSYEQIAGECYLTVSTVKYRVKKMLSRCHLGSRKELLTLLHRYIPQGKTF